MDRVLLGLLDMSMTAGFAILCILPVRWLLRRSPKVFSYALWAVVLFRLLCPVAVSSSFSLLGVFRAPLETVWGSRQSESLPGKNSDTEPGGLNTGKGEVQGIDVLSSKNDIKGSEKSVNDQKNDSKPAEGTDGINALSGQTVKILTGLWLAGVGSLLLYSLLSVWRLRRRLVGAVLLRDTIWLADRIAAPFVIGVIRPRIYLPSTLSVEEQGYILLHEQTHIRRKDYLIKPLAFLALCLHWFNPLVWLAFFLAVRDMEMSCDESVLRQMGEDIRCEYSTSLLNLTVGRQSLFGGGTSLLAPTPLAFGEGDTKARIRNILSFQKPAVWLLAASCVIVAALGIGLFCNPKQAESKEDNSFVQMEGNSKAEKDPKTEGNPKAEGTVLTEETMAGEKFVAENSCLWLRTDGSFEFNRHIATSYNPRGTWSVEGEDLRLTGFQEGEEFLFHIREDALVFAEGTDLVEKGTIYRKSEEDKWALRPMIFVNGALYLDTNQPIPVEMDESAILGTVAESVACWERPWQEGWTNCGMVGSPYAYYEDGVVVCYDHEWYFFEPNQETEAPDTEDVPVDLQEIDEQTALLEGSAESSDPMWVPTKEEALFMALIGHNRDRSETTEEEAPIRTASWITVGKGTSGTPGEEPETITYYLIGRLQKFEKQEPDDSQFPAWASRPYGDHNVIPGSQTLVWVRVSLEKREDIYQNTFYRDTDYWQIAAGEAAIEGMKEKFPKEFWQETLRYEEYQLALAQECYAQAIRAAGMEGDVQTRIDQLLNEVTSSPAESSNPGDYLKAHPAEVEELLSYGEYTRQYAKEWLEAGEATSLRGILLEWLLEKLEETGGA